MPQSSPETPPKALQVLIVDDDALDRRAARRALQSTGLAAEIVEAERGDEALALLQSRPFDAVLLDFELPDADGLRVLRDLQARGLPAPVIMLTGHGDDQTAAELMKAGAADYVAKSRLTPDALGRSLRHALRVGEAEAQAARAEAESGRLLASLAAEQGQMEAVLNSMTEGLVIGDLNGRVVAMNPAALAMHRYADGSDIQWPMEGFADTFSLAGSDGQELPAEEWPLARVLQGAAFSACEITVRHRETGQAWTGSFGGTLARGRDGEPILAVLTVRDVTEANRARARAAFLAEASARLSSSLDVQTTLDNVVRLAVPRLTDWCAVNVRDPSGRIRSLVTALADPEVEALVLALQEDYPLDPAAPLGVGHVLLTGEAQLIADCSDAVRGRIARDAEHHRRMCALGVTSYLCVPLRARGRVLGTLSFTSLRADRRYTTDDLDLAQELGRRVAAALDNARLFDEVRARAEREAMINKIGGALRVSLDVDEILQIVTEQVGQALNVGRCSFARLNAARDTVEAAPQQYAAPGVPLAPFRFRLADVPPVDVDQWVAGQPVVVADAASRPPIPGTEQARAYIACPVFLRGQFGGLFTVAQADGPREWTEDEAAFVTAVSDILALALENARLYAREHRVADMLSSAFLPDIPDVLPGLSLASSYRAGLEEAHVGGDYYDAFLLPDGRVALVIADVSGKGLSAAVQTATVKYSLRAFASEAAAPGLVLTRLNKTLCSDLSGLGDNFVTLFYAVFDPASGRLAWGSAGHETVLIKRAAGGANLLEANNPILGLADHAYEQAEDALGPGDALVLFTDGLTEARAVGTREMLEIERVHALVAAVPAGAGAGALAARLQQEAMRWTGGRPHDDMALLVARRAAPLDAALAAVEATDSLGPPLLSFREAATSGEVRSPEGGDRLFDFRLPARADSAAEVRQAVGHWMPSLGFGLDATQDFQTAVTEAVTNAVRHGSSYGDAGGGALRVRGLRTGEGALWVEVTDGGAGLPPTLAQAVMPSPEAPSGRGLPLMRLLADAVEFRLETGGHCVALLKRRPAEPPG